jgi:hypothetical protein
MVMTTDVVLFQFYRDKRRPETGILDLDCVDIEIDFPLYKLNTIVLRACGLEL